MRKTYHRRKIVRPRYRVNQYIRVPEVQVVDEEGKHLGIMETHKALALAQEKGYDLVEVSPIAHPPVCRIQDWGQVKYKQEKLKQKSKTQAAKTETKGVRLSFRIGAHDLEVQKNKAVNFLERRHRVKIDLRLRGRERTHMPRAFEIVRTFILSLNEYAELDGGLSRQGGQITATVKPKS